MPWSNEIKLFIYYTLTFAHKKSIIIQIIAEVVFTFSLLKINKICNLVRSAETFAYCICQANI